MFVGILLLFSFGLVGVITNRPWTNPLAAVKYGNSEYVECWVINWTLKTQFTRVVVRFCDFHCLILLRTEINRIHFLKIVFIGLSSRRRPD